MTDEVRRVGPLDRGHKPEVLVESIARDVVRGSDILVRGVVPHKCRIKVVLSCPKKKKWVTFTLSHETINEGMARNVIQERMMRLQGA